MWSSPLKPKVKDTSKQETCSNHCDVMKKFTQNGTFMLFCKFIYGSILFPNVNINEF